MSLSAPILVKPIISVHWSVGRELWIFWDMVVSYCPLPITCPMGVSLLLILLLQFHFLWEVRNLLSLWAARRTANVLGLDGILFHLFVLCCCHNYYCCSHYFCGLISSILQFQWAADGIFWQCCWLCCSLRLCLVDWKIFDASYLVEGFRGHWWST